MAHKKKKVMRPVSEGTKRKARQFSDIAKGFTEQFGGFGKKKKKTKTPHGKRAPSK